MIGTVVLAALVGAFFGFLITAVLAADRRQKK